MKILYVTTIGITMGFFKSFIGYLIENGHTVEIATNEAFSKVPGFYREKGCKIHNISCTRSPLNSGTFKAIREIEKLVAENDYDIVHCHTPIAAMCTRLACRKQRKKGLKVIYTAHGFHFYKGAPLKNRLIFYPIEKICSYLTDVLITINKEDYGLAMRKMKAKKVEYVPGVGIDVEKFANACVDREAKRKELGIPGDATLLLSVGELNGNKNHRQVIKAISRLGDKNIYYAVAGEGEQRDSLISLAREEGMADRLLLLGYRKDVCELYKTADLFVHPSFREGLPVALMEAIASGVPCIASDIRGCSDLLSAGLFSPDSCDSLASAIKSGGEKVCIDEAFSIESVNRKIMEIYCG